MCDEIQHVKTLSTARNKIIEERRALAVAIALGYRRRRTDDSQTNDMRETFIGLQNLVEALERAITHENALASGDVETFVIPPPQPDATERLRLDNRQ
jgi:hypothetical protein